MAIDIKQAQSLLNALGYDCGTVDGIWGSKSQAAMDAALADYHIASQSQKSSFDVLVESTVKTEDVSFWTSVKHFNRAEFRCQCGGRYCNGYPAEMSEQLIRIADEIRSECNAPAHVTSGLRCEKHNSETPGAVANSTHITGRAMDFYVDGMTSAALLNKVKYKAGVAYCYAVTDRVVHMNV